ncbi:MAG: EAL domain-containing protein [Actinocatenispora sp.]
MTASGSVDPPVPATGVDRLSRSWAAVVAGTSYVPIDGAELAAHLLPLADRLLTALGAGTAPDPVGGPGAAVGRALVAAHFTNTETLHRTLVLLGNALPAFPGGADRESRAALLSALATGYAGALRDRTLNEQEAIRQAAMTAQARAERALRDSEARFLAVFRGATTGIALGDLTGHIIEANQALGAMLGRSTEELRGRGVFDLVHPDDVDDLRAQIYQRVASGTVERVRTEKRFIHSDGRVVWGLLAVSVVRDAEGRPSYLVAMGEDNTRRHELQDRLTFRATRDSLTGLANRTLFTERLQQVFDRASATSRLGLCFLDLDGFKIINDSLGHDIGDRLLRVVADRLSAAVGDEHVVARLGGDEFVILVTDSTGEEQLTGLAERVLCALAPPIELDGHELAVSASIGVVERSTFGTGPAEVMRAADITLYWAKAEGKGRWATFDADRDAREAARYQLSEAMPAALTAGEFRVAYQPIISLDDGCLVAVEALVRWLHPQFGLLAPDEFLGVAEETGLVVPLGRWVLRTACRQARSWLDRYGWTPLVSVNMTVRQVCDEGLADDVRRVLAETGLPADRLQLELTERALMDTEPLAALRLLNDMGVRIVIDDFGTGYSNLAHLRRAPVNGIKLARSFTRSFDAPEHPDRVDLAIVRTLVSLAHTLEMEVIAGGVETPRQSERLREVGCERGQGWLFGRPAEPAEIDGLLAGGPVSLHG